MLHRTEEGNLYPHHQCFSSPQPPVEILYLPSRIPRVRIVTSIPDPDLPLPLITRFSASLCRPPWRHTFTLPSLSPFRSERVFCPPSTLHTIASRRLTPPGRFLSPPEHLYDSSPLFETSRPMVSLFVIHTVSLTPILLIFLL
jgi:hypothetical protein